MRSDAWLPVLVAALLLVSGCLSASSSEPLAQPGHPAPAATFETIDGEPWVLAEHRGSVVVIDAMSPFCTTCREQMSELDQLWEANEQAGVELVSVDVGAAMATGGAQETMTEFQEHFNASWTFAVDVNATFLVEYRVTIIPTIFVIGPEGTVEARLPGQDGGVDTIQAAIDRALDGAAG